MPGEGNDNGGKVEKIAQNALLTVVGRFAMVAVLPVMGYMAVAMIDMGRTLIVIQSENAASKRVADAQVEALKGIVENSLLDRYRSTDAVRDQRGITLQIEAVRQGAQIQIDENKRRLEVLERQVPGSARGR